MPGDARGSHFVQSSSWLRNVISCRTSKAHSAYSSAYLVLSGSMAGFSFRHSAATNGVRLAKCAFVSMS